MRGRSRGQATLRAIAVVGVALAPFAAIDADAAVNTGPAQANGPGIKFENSGGNREFGKGHQESKVTKGNPEQRPPAAPALGTLSTPAPKVAPAVDRNARARALADAARARAQAQIDAARQQAAEAVEQARRQAEEARAQGEAQSAEARAHSSSYSTDD